MREKVRLTRAATGSMEPFHDLKKRRIMERFAYPATPRGSEFRHLDRKNVRRCAGLWAVAVIAMGSYVLTSLNILRGRQGFYLIQNVYIQRIHEESNHIRWRVSKGHACFVTR